MLDGDQTRADYYQTQYNILQSRALARRTLDELKLWDTPPFGGKSDEGFSLKRTILGAPAVACSTWCPASAGPIRRRVADIGKPRSPARLDEKRPRSRGRSTRLRRT